MAKESIKKLVLAYSGGLDTSVILRWIRDEFGCEVVAFCADVGQAEETAGLEEKALKTGADKFHLIDLREEFARDFVFPMMRANAVYEGYYLLGTSIARPVIAKKLAELARAEGADAVGHGATGKGNDQVRYELTLARLAPELKIIAPWRHPAWPFKGRADMIAYANEKKIPLTVTEEKPYSMDRNLVHVSYEGGILEDPWREPYQDMFRLTVSPEDAPDKAEYVEIEYAEGNPVAINGERLAPAALIERANQIGGRHGIGRVDMVENRYVGIKSRGVYETPGVTILTHGHRAVEQLTLDREVMHLRDSLIPRYSEMVYYGYWFAPEREALQALIDEAQTNVSGIARLKLYKGGASIAGRKSPNSLYDSEDRELRRGGRLSAGRRGGLHPARGAAACGLWRCWKRAKASRRAARGEGHSVQASARSTPRGAASARRRLPQLPTQDERAHHASQRRDHLRRARMPLREPADRRMAQGVARAPRRIVSLSLVADDLARKTIQVPEGRLPQYPARPLCPRAPARGRGLHRVAAVRSAALSPRHPRLDRARRHAREGEADLRGRRPRRSSTGLRDHRARDRGRQVQVRSRRRGHSYRDRAPPDRDRRRRGPQAPYRALAQRSGRARFAAVPER